MSTRNVKKVLNYSRKSIWPTRECYLGWKRLPQGSGPNLYYDDLAKALNAYSTAERKIYLGAAPQCPIPDYYRDTTIKTGLFDYIVVQFYNNPPCQSAPGNPTNLFNSWDAWTSRVPPITLYCWGYQPTQV
ncbi:hypothetical protein L6164_008808 [Bauhinia variegata]|uniref:Uncharacterized protein n=1 Tax=Bauhinia variegata TaxID=167791 RepID=A0ACB9PKP7_BAUVA|nr:hypothetical protein L6164_008808 [Bauhinia variegata]